MHCSRCNNTHWQATALRTFNDYLALGLLRRPFSCLKCERIQNGTLWLKSVRPPRERKCPKCGGEARRSRRHGLEKTFPFWRAYRCKKCESRFRALSLRGT